MIGFAMRANALYFLIDFLFFSWITVSLIWGESGCQFRQPCWEKTGFKNGTTSLKPLSGIT
jgi:hypothetical protein